MKQTRAGILLTMTLIIAILPLTTPTVLATHTQPVKGVLSLWNEAGKSNTVIGPAPVGTLFIMEVNFTSTETANAMNGFDVQVDFDGTRLQATGAGGRPDAFLGTGSDLCSSTEPIASRCIFVSSTQFIQPPTNAITANSVRFGISTLTPSFVTDEGTLFRIRFRVLVASGFTAITINHAVSSVTRPTRIGFCEVNGFFANDSVSRQPPVLASIGAKALNEETPLSFIATATDPELGPVTFCAALGNAAGASMTPAGAFSWTPSEAQGPGSYTVVVMVFDNTNLVDKEGVTITVNEVNRAPVLFLPADILPPTHPRHNFTAIWDEILSFTVSASDGDIPRQTLTFSMTGGPPGHTATMDPFGEFLWPATPRPQAQQGSLTFTVSVTDGIATTSIPVRVCILYQGDVDYDGGVTGQDLGRIGASFLKPASADPPADVNRDGSISGQDLGVMGSQFLLKC